MSQSSRKLSRRDIVRGVTTALLEQPASQPLWIQRLAAYIVENRLHSQTDLIINDIAYELYIQSSQLTVEVVSPRELTAALRTSLTGYLQSQTGATRVVLHESVDAKLLGGFVARTADAEIDASVQTKLRELATLA